jgi:hypothetical protein
VKVEFRLCNKSLFVNSQDVGSCVKSENLRIVLTGQAQDVVMVIIDLDAMWNDVFFEEAEIRIEHLIMEPNSVFNNQLS